jgi:acyl-CoA synthetase (AMP-forming)/AMP-acid ligase II
MTSRWNNLGDLVDRTADLDRTAVVDLRDAAAPRTWSHRDLDRASDAAASALRKRGLKRGDRVAILAVNRVEYLAASLIMRAGLVAVPLNIAPRAAIEFALRDAAVSRVVATPKDIALPADLPSSTSMR